MTQEQIEKAARELDIELFEACKVRFDPNNPYEYQRTRLRISEVFLTRFAQQCEADALERAANEIWRDNRRSDDLAGFRQHSLQWEAGHTNTLESLRSRAAAIRNGLSTTKQEG